LRSETHFKKQNFALALLFVLSYKFLFYKTSQKKDQISPYVNVFLSLFPESLYFIFLIMAERTLSGINHEEFKKKADSIATTENCFIIKPIENEDLIKRVKSQLL
jgi:hypothetical protein